LNIIQYTVWGQKQYVHGLDPNKHLDCVSESRLGHGWISTLLFQPM